MDNDTSIMCMVKISARVFLYVYLSVPLSHASSSLCVYTHVHKSGFLSLSAWCLSPSLCVCKPFSSLLSPLYYFVTLPTLMIQANP